MNGENNVLQKPENLLYGAFLISRSIFNSEIWAKPPIYLKAFLWILGRANHQSIKRGGYVYHRGEFFTTYDEFRAAMSFFYNRKKVIPSLQQARDTLNFLTFRGLIRRSPTTGTDTGTYTGIKIEVINYDTYQDINNYRNRDKNINFNTTSTGLQHNNKNDNNKKKYYVADSVESRLATLLLTEIRKNKPDFKEPNLQAWAQEIDFMIRRDDRDPDRIEQVIVWCQGDQFWWKNVLSASKLRKQFDRLEADISSGKGRAPAKVPLEVEYRDLTGGGVS